MGQKQPIAAVFSALHWALLAAAYARLAEKAFLRFPTDWDFLAYHFPGALQAVGLYPLHPGAAARGGDCGLSAAAADRRGSARARDRPLLGRGDAEPGRCRLPGRRARLAVRRALSLRWLLTALLAVPLCVIHLTSGYVDLFTACWLALAFAALSELEPGARRPRGRGAGDRRARGRAARQVPGLAGGGNHRVAVVWRLFALVRAGAL
jgi:hypothetical protein